jgi:hypothetical protein
VNVTAVAASAGAGLSPTITISTPTKAHNGPIAITPINTITGYTPIQANTGTPPYPLAVSAQNGVFEGKNWSFQIGTNFLIDAGAQQEIGVIVPTPAGQSGPYFQCATTATGQFVNNHPGPYTTSYPIPTVGNPGPQPSFNLRQVPWVVRYFSIIN